MTTRSVTTVAGIAVVAVLAALFVRVPATAAPVGDDTAPVPSAGCNDAPTTPGLSAHLFSAAGRSGDYLQMVPQAEPDTPMPLVFDVHGYLQPGLMQATWSQMSIYGADHGFAVITPETHVLPPKWDTGNGGSDIAFLSELLTHIEQTLCIDKRRVFMTGLSMGGFTASSVACQLADRFAAIAPVAGLQDFSWCAPSRPVPVIAFHGTGDEILPYSGGVGPRGMLLPALDGSPRTIGGQIADGDAIHGMPNAAPIPVQAAAWAHRNGCAPEPQESPVAIDVVHTTYDCPHDGAVELYTVDGGGHNWPGGDPLLAVTPITGPIATSISATEIIWQFFDAHPLRGALSS